jgi:peptidoglycan hydrolase-like protein with peptidoglycan-binding domain
MRRITFGALGAGMVVAMAAGATTAAASASVAAPHSATAAHPDGYLNWPVVQYGDHGIRVRTIQYLLDQRGANLIITGAFGSATKAAVKAFQWRNHLQVDGKVGNKTWPRLVITVRRGSPFRDANRAVQDQLRDGYGYHFVVVNGHFGLKTEIAVRAFQHRFRILSDGIVGLGTWNTLVKFDPF